jgi:high-affinity Fe2+/Pb2+ permease
VSNPHPLPPEPVTTPAGKTVGLLLWLVVLTASGLVLMGIWGAGDPETLLKVLATAGLVALLGSLLAMASRGR